MEWLVEQSGNADSDVFSLDQLRRLLPGNEEERGGNQLRRFLPGEEERDDATSSKTDNILDLERLGAAALNQGNGEVDLEKEDEEGRSSEDESEDDNLAVEEEESTGDEDTGCFEDETFIRRRSSETRVEVGCE